MTLVIPAPEDFDPGPVHVSIHRLNTTAFIRADPSHVILDRKEKIPLSDGGYRWTSPIPQPLQIMRLIPSSDAMPEVQTADGVTLVPSYVLLAEWDANMERGDKFSLYGANYEIVSPIRPLHTDNPYYRKGDVAKV